MKREAEIYLSLSQIPEIAPHLTRFFCYDSEENVLVLEYLRDVKDLSRHLAESGRVSNTISRSMGDVLGLLHRIDLSQLMGDVAMPSEPPWILSIHRPSLQSLRDVSPANLDLIRMVQATPTISEKARRIESRMAARCDGSHGYPMEQLAHSRPEIAAKSFTDQVARLGDGLRRRSPMGYRLRDLGPPAVVGAADSRKRGRGLVALCGQRHNTHFASGPAEFLAPILRSDLP